MSRNARIVDATPETVWEVLSDGWLYPLWVVGASRMREVDEGWPAVGTRLHHSVGSWPLLLDDITEVKENTPGARLVLHAHAWPGGVAEVVLSVQAHQSRTEIVIHEKTVAGPGRLVPTLVEDPLLHWRNTETLRRLALLVERRP